MNKLSIIIPVFNEEKTISELLRRVLFVKLPFGIKKEIIVISDGSTDNTDKILAGQKRIKYLRHIRNLGKGAAVKTGLKTSTGDLIIIQDADLEYNPKDMPKLLRVVQDGKADVVYGTRLKRLPNLARDERTLRFLFHYLGNRFLSLLASIFYGQWLTDMETGYKLFSRRSIQGLKLQAKSFEFEPEITSKLLKRGYKIIEVPITTNPRGYDEGKKLDTLKDGLIAFWTIIKYRFND